MGRKSIHKERKALTPKAELWVRALFPLLQHREIEKLTLEELAALMGKSKSTIYTYFSTKNEIYAATVMFILNDLEHAIYGNFPHTHSMEEKYRFILLHIAEGLNGLSIKFLDGIKEHFPTIWNDITTFVDRLLETFRDIYQTGMDNKEFHRYNIDLMMAMDTHFVVGILTDTERFKKARLTAHDLVTQYLELRINALILK